MKISLKLIILWFASLVLFAGVGVAVVVAPDWLNGVHGLAIRFFLGYCGIVVVAQAFAFMEVIRRLREDPVGKSRSYHTGIESS